MESFNYKRFNLIMFLLTFCFVIILYYELGKMVALLNSREEHQLIPSGLSIAYSLRHYLFIIPLGFLILCTPCKIFKNTNMVIISITVVMLIIFLFTMMLSTPIVMCCYFIGN